jgi:hypothetical protein
LPLSIAMVVTMGSPKVGVASIWTLSRRLPHPYELVGWPDAQVGLISHGMQLMLPIGGGVFTSTLK